MIKKKPLYTEPELLKNLYEGDYVIKCQENEAMVNDLQKRGFIKVMTKDHPDLKGYEWLDGIAFRLASKGRKYIDNQLNQTLIFAELFLNHLKDCTQITIKKNGCDWIISIDPPSINYKTLYHEILDFEFSIKAGGPNEKR